MRVRTERSALREPTRILGATMHLVQILLPLHGNDGKAVLREAYKRIRERFGGLTAFAQSPAEGLWTPAVHQTHRDDVVLIEVMVDNLDSE
jgi:hypothetical protein